MLDLETSLRALAAGSSRRGVLARLAKGLVGAALLSSSFPMLAHASSCQCSGQTKCGVGCGGRPTNSHFCCSCDPPCWNCGGGGCSSVNNCLGATCCVGTGYTPGWYWYCCKHAPTSSSSALIPPNELWKCQDCCNSSGSCYTARDVVAEC